MYILSLSSSSLSEYAHIGFASTKFMEFAGRHHNINNIISDCISTHPYYIQLTVPILYCFVTMLYYHSSIRAAGSSCCVTEL